MLPRHLRNQMNAITNKRALLRPDTLTVRHSSEMDIGKFVTLSFVCIGVYIDALKLCVLRRRDIIFPTFE